MSAENSKDWYRRMLDSVEWQRIVAEIRIKEDLTCQCCKDKTTPVDVHHTKYTGRPFDAKRDDLVLLCRHCHKSIEKFKLPWGKGLTAEKKFYESLVSVVISHPEGVVIASFDKHYIGHILNFEDKDVSRFVHNKINQWQEDDEQRFLRDQEYKKD